MKKKEHQTIKTVVLRELVSLLNTNRCLLLACKDATVLARLNKDRAVKWFKEQTSKKSQRLKKWNEIKSRHLTISSTYRNDQIYRGSSTTTKNKQQNICLVREQLVGTFAHSKVITLNIDRRWGCDCCSESILCRPKHKINKTNIKFEIGARKK